MSKRSKTDMSNKSKSQICCWDFTVSAIRANQTEITFHDIKIMMNENCKKWAFQKEEGEGGYIHYQGRVSLNEKVRNITLGADIGMHWSPTMTDNINNYDYVTKEQSRIAGPWTWEDKETFIPEHVERVHQGTLYPFQQEIINTRKIKGVISKTVYDRGINVIVHPIGGGGKTMICAIAEHYYNAIVVPPLNDAKELMGAVHGMITAKDMRDPELIICDLPRAMNKKTLNGLYVAIEQLKSGKVYDLRYKYKVAYFNPCPVWVFTNEEPNLNCLSLDRWTMWHIDSKKQLQQYIPGFPDLEYRPKETITKKGPELSELEAYASDRESSDDTMIDLDEPAKEQDTTVPLVGRQLKYLPFHDFVKTL